MRPPAAALPLPAKNASVAELELEYFPALARAALAGVPFLPFAAEVQVDVGDESFAFTLAEGVSARPGPAASPVIRCVISPADLRRTAREVLPRALRRLEAHVPRLRAGWARVRARLAAFDTGELRRRPGVVEIEYADDAGDRVRFAYHIGGGAGPRVLLRVTEAELFGLVARGVRLARLAGPSLKVEGDAAYLLRLATLLEAGGR